MGFGTNPRKAASTGGGGFSRNGVSPETLQPLTLEEYAERKRLPLEFLQEMGLSTVYIPDAAVRVPYPTCTQFIFKDAKRFKSKDKPCLYVTSYRLGDEEEATLVEGVSDTLTCWYNNISAIGFPGASMWSEERNLPHFEKFLRVYVNIEPDAGGEAVKKWLARSELRHKALLISMPEGFKDPSEMWIADPSKFMERWKRAIANARSLDDIEQEEKAAARLKEWERCKDIALSPRILDRFAEELPKHNLASEDRNAKIVFLEFSSRVRKRPPSLSVFGASSTGKSYFVKVGSRFFPEGEAWIAMSSMSDHALIYLEDISLRHKILIVYELAGITSDKALYFIRTLQSEGHVKHLVTVKDEATGKRITKMLEVEGPAGVIITTTGVKIHTENDTRHLSLYSNESPEATTGSMIASSRRREDKGVPDTSTWISLARWHAASNQEVTLYPWSEKLARILDNKHPRIRRDFEAILDYVETHASLHQATREVDERGRIIATQDDYEVVADLLDSVVSTGLGLRVRKIIRETVNKVRNLLEEDTDKPSVSVAQLCAALDITKGPMSHRVRDALEIGYLKNLNHKRVPYELAIGEPMPEDKERMLPAWSELQSSAIADDSAKVEDPPPPTVELGLEPGTLQPSYKHEPHWMIKLPDGTFATYTDEDLEKYGVPEGGLYC